MISIFENKNKASARLLRALQKTKIILVKKDKHQ